MWDSPQHDTPSAWVSSACRGDPHNVQWWCGICNNAVLKFVLLVRLLNRHRIAAGDRRNLQSGRCKRSNPAAEAFQRQISASAKSQRGRVFVAEEKKSEMRRQSGHLYSQTPHLFWRAMEGCIAIGLCAAAESLVCVLVLHEPMDVQLHCVIKKGFRWRGKNSFSPYKRLRHSTSEISKGNYSLNIVFNVFLLALLVIQYFKTEM